jgi:hypothetical protein
MCNFVGAEPFRPLDHDSAMKRLNSIRNAFIHFRIDGWTIEISGLHSIYRAAADAIEFAANSVNFPWHYSSSFEAQKDASERTLLEIRDLAAKPFNTGP